MSFEDGIMSVELLTLGHSSGHLEKTGDRHWSGWSLRDHTTHEITSMLTLLRSRMKKSLKPEFIPANGMTFGIVRLVAIGVCVLC